MAPLVLVVWFGLWSRSGRPLEALLLSTTPTPTGSNPVVVGLSGRLLLKKATVENSKPPEIWPAKLCRL